MLQGTLECKYLFEIIALFTLIYTQNETSGYYCSFVFNFLRNLYTVFHSGCTKLHSFLHILIASAAFISCLFDKHCPNRYKVLSDCDFWLSLPWWLVMRSNFHVPIDHLYVFFGKMSTQILAHFSIKLFWFFTVVCVLHIF